MSSHADEQTNGLKLWTAADLAAEHEARVKALADAGKWHAIEPTSEGEEHYRRGYRDGFRVCLDEIWDLFREEHVPFDRAYDALFRFATAGRLLTWQREADPGFETPPSFSRKLDGVRSRGE